MKHRYLHLLLVFFCLALQAQQSYHVFPENHKDNPGSPQGKGSMNNPWDLQTALSNKTIINPGDVIWIHEGIYNGRYISEIYGNDQDKVIVSAYKNDRVVINGNVTSENGAVLHVTGSNVIFKNFQITFFGTFPRYVDDTQFKVVVGIKHDKGESCEFRNLKINNVPGSGIGSWKHTGGSSIENCIVFNNGYMGKKRGHGVGIYVQNKSTNVRLIKNNLIFNNYYKGIEIWSASKGHDYEFVKNVTLLDNVIFNNGLPSGHHRGNVIVATNDSKGINRAKNIKLINNILYHNTDFINDKKNNGDASSLNIGYNIKAPPKSIIVRDNLIVGKNNALAIYNIDELQFENNTIYTGYIHVGKKLSQPINFSKWSFKNNRYYTKKSTGFFLYVKQKKAMKDWQSNNFRDKNSHRFSFEEFNLDPILHISEIDAPTKTFQLVLFDKEGDEVTVDFSKYNIVKNIAFTIKSVEDDRIIKSGTLDDNKTIVFPMGTYNQTAANFGVYRIEFDQENEKEKKRKGFFKRLFGWLF